MNDAEILQRLSDLSIELPDPPRAVAAYVPVRIAGDVAYVAGQVPVVDGEVVHPGRLGDPDSGPTPEDAALDLSPASTHLVGSPAPTPFRRDTNSTVRAAIHDLPPPVTGTLLAAGKR